MCIIITDVAKALYSIDRSRADNPSLYFNGDYCTVAWTIRQKQEATSERVGHCEDSEDTAEVHGDPSAACRHNVSRA